MIVFAVNERRSPAVSTNGNAASGAAAGAASTRASSASRSGRARWSFRSGVLMRASTSGHVSTAKIMPDGLAITASNTPTATSIGEPVNPARASDGPAAIAAFAITPNTTAPARSSSGRSIVR